MPHETPQMPAEVTDFVAELQWRGLYHQSTDDAAANETLRRHLADPESSPRKAYAGFDPTADSLTIGNLVAIMLLVHFARAGHQPIVLMGGGTGLIGDPSGKSAERQLQTPEMVRANIDKQRGIFERVFANAGLPAPTIVNNLDWLGSLSYIEALRDIGKHFSVNMMMQKESVKSRLESREQGISYTEFSYMILQAYDFAHLFQHEGVTLQMGGSDQFGNIGAGSDLIRRARSASDGDESIAFGLTAPLVTKADGGKFGKTETGAVWLTAERTSAYAMYQFWLNADDSDVIKFFKLFTLLSKAEIEALEAAHAAEPHKRKAHRALAMHATSLVHGEAAAIDAKAASEALFSGDVRTLSADLLDQVFEGVPSSAHSMADLAGDGLDLVELLIQTTLAKSKREAREFIGNGSVSINGEKATEGRALVEADLLHGSIIALRRGKKKWHVTRWA
ncbi:MAG: tyrosine--tRNA ligase [Planctomycetota bacterium]